MAIRVFVRLQAALSAVLLLLAAAAVPATAAAFVDAAGRRVILPDRVYNIMPAERNAEVLLLVMAPDKLAGFSRVPGRSAVLPRAGRLPVLAWRPRTDPSSMAATAQRLRPDLILDAGLVNPERAAFADRVQALTGIPYILVDSSFTRMPTVLRGFGATLGDLDRGTDLAIFAEHAIAGLRGRLLIRPANSRPRVYYARGPDGLTTALPGSPAGEAIEEAGAINVARPLGRATEVRVSPEELLAWNPDIIVVHERRAYEAFRRSPAWRRLAAVHNKKVYLEPGNPFGWIENPSGVNRLIGLHWLSTIFYPDATQEDLRTTVCDFYDKFYEIKLTNKQLEAMLGPAGVRPPEAPRQLGEPLVGLGAAPPSTLPNDATGAVPSAPSGLPPSPGMPRSAGQTDTCVVPHGPQPEPLTPSGTPGITEPGTPPAIAPGTPGAAPGARPPGRRGRPSVLLQQPEIAPGKLAAGPATDPALPADALGIAVDKDGKIVVDGEIVPAGGLTEALERARSRRER